MITLCFILKFDLFRIFWKCVLKKLEFSKDKRYKLVICVFVKVPISLTRTGRVYGWNAYSTKSECNIFPLRGRICLCACTWPTFLPASNTGGRPAIVFSTWKHKSCIDVICYSGIGGRMDNWCRYAMQNRRIALFESFVAVLLGQVMTDIDTKICHQTWKKNEGPTGR